MQSPITFRALTLTALLAVFGAITLTWQPRGAAANAAAPTVAVFSERDVLTPPNGQPQDRFGRAVAVSADGLTLVAGAPDDDIGAGAGQGSAYVYEFENGHFAFKQQLFVAGVNVHEFGRAVALTNTTIALGAPGEDNKGAVYVFVKNGALWTQQQRLTPFGASNGDNFGSSVSLAGDTLAVGTSETVGLNANQGSTFIFTRNGVTWSQQAKLLANDGAAGDNFGASVALSGETVLIGAPNDTVGLTGNQGSAYVFVRSGAAWSQQQKLSFAGAEANDYIGQRVALDGDTALIGAWGDDVGFNNDQGAAYVFTRSGATWSQQQKLTANNGAAGDYFGWGVALLGNRALIGAFNKTIINTQFQGAAYVFDRSGTVWTEQQALTPFVPQPGYFGYSVALGGATAAAGAYATNNNAGAAYAYRAANSNPQLINVPVLTRSAGSGTTTPVIGQVSDAEQAANTLQATVNNAASATVNGVTVSALTIDASGALRANVNSACNAGDASFTLRVTDSEGAAALATLTVNLTPNLPPVLSYAATHTVGQGGALTINPTAGPSDNGGVSQVSILSVTPALTGTITVNNAGVVTVGNAGPLGAHTVTVRVLDNCALVNTASFTLNVTAAGCTVSFPQTLLPASTVGQLYNVTFAATGGTVPYTYAVTAGTPPSGLTLSAAGVLSGTLTAAGDFNFTVQATDANGCTATRQAAIHINGVIQPQPVAKKGDFDGDGKADLAYWRGATSDWAVIRSSDGQLQTTSWGAGYAPYFDVIVPGDYDGDGKQDHAIWRGQDSLWYVKKSSDGLPLVLLWGANYAPYNDVPTPGDFDGDGKTDMAVWRPTDGAFYVKRSSNQTNLVMTWGQQGDIPVAADYDGDGKTDFAVWRPSTGDWLIQKSSGGTQTIQWGAGYAPYFDVPVVADYNGDGKADPAIWRGQDSLWYIKQSSNGQPLVQLWGANYAPYFDVPVPADYDGDGWADIAVWRPTDGTWYIKRSSNNTNFVQAHGQQGDTPVPAHGVK